MLNVLFEYHYGLNHIPEKKICDIILVLVYYIVVIKDMIKKLASRITWQS